MPREWSPVSRCVTCVCVSVYVLAPGCVFRNLPHDRASARNTREHEQTISTAVRQQRRAIASVHSKKSRKQKCLFHVRSRSNSELEKMCHRVARTAEERRFAQSSSDCGRPRTETERARHRVHTRYMRSSEAERLFELVGGDTAPVAKSLPIVDVRRARRENELFVDDDSMSRDNKCLVTR